MIVIYTNSAQQAVFSNTGVTFNKQLTVPSTILKPSGAPANENFIGYTNTTKLTNSIALGAGYTLLMSFSTSVAGTYSFDVQLRLEWVVGTALWNQVIYGILLSSLVLMQIACMEPLSETLEWMLHVVLIV